MSFLVSTLQFSNHKTSNFSFCCLELDTPFTHTTNVSIPPRLLFFMNCWWTGNEGFQYFMSRFREKYGRKTVFSTLDGACNTLGLIITKNCISIFGHLSKSFLLVFNT